MSPRAVAIWIGLAAAIAVPIALAATSPLLAWRGAAYIAAGFAGIIALALLLVQPLLAGGYLPGLAARRGRGVHRWVGIALVTAVVAHVAGLWLSNPPDLIDALLLRSPTPFSLWGVIAMWATFAAALLAVLRRRLRPKTWRLAHTAFAMVIGIGSVVHALLVEGTMEPVSKAVFCGVVLVAIVKVVWDLRAWALLARRRG